MRSGKHLRLAMASWLLLVCAGMAAQCLITAPNYTYTQDFGTSVISASGTNITSASANLVGWMYDAALTSEINITAAAPTNTGGRYAYTLNGNSNRKIGSRPSSGTGNVKYGILFQNTSGQTIQSFSVSYTGYQLSQGGNTSAAVNQLIVDYIVSASPIAITAAGGTAMPGLTFSQTQFVTSSNTGSQGAGYPAATGTGGSSGCISVAASIPDNSYLLIRWNDADDPQNDPHLAIDDVVVTFFTNQTVSNNTACSFLPLELLDFYGEQQETANQVVWKVAQEEQISAYDVERSTDGISFTSIGRVASDEAQAGIKIYSFLDPAPGTGMAYYRLTALERNGGRKNYRIISLDRASISWTGTVYPSGGELLVEFRQGLPAKGIISIYDLAGNKIAEQLVNDVKESINIRTFAEGIYVVRITSPDKAENTKVAITHQ